MTLLYVYSSNAIILMGKRKLAALLNLSSWCLVMVERLFLVVSRGCLRFVIVVFPDHTHLLFCAMCLTQSFSIIFGMLSGPVPVTFFTFMDAKSFSTPFGFIFGGGI